MEVADQAGCLSGHCNLGSHILCCLLSLGDSSFSFCMCAWQAAAASCGTSAWSSQATCPIRIFIRSGVSPGFGKPAEPMPQMPTYCFCSACCAHKHSGLLVCYRTMCSGRMRAEAFTQNWFHCPWVPVCEGKSTLFANQPGLNTPSNSCSDASSYSEV